MSRGSPAAITQWHKEPPMPAALQGPQRPSPGQIQEILACGRALPSKGFWKELSLATSYTNICTSTRAGALPSLAAAGPRWLSATQVRFPQKAGGGPTNPIIPMIPLGIISSSPPRSTNRIWPKAARGTPEQDRQAPRAQGALEQGLLCLSASYLQRQKLSSELCPPAAFQPSSASASTEMVS